MIENLDRLLEVAARYHAGTAPWHDTDALQQAVLQIPGVGGVVRRGPEPLLRDGAGYGDEPGGGLTVPWVDEATVLEIADPALFKPYRSAVENIVKGLLHAKSRDGAANSDRAPLSDERLLDFIQVGSDWYWETDAEGRFVTMFGNWPYKGVRDVIGRNRIDVISRLIPNAQLAAHMQDIERRLEFRDFMYGSPSEDGEIRFSSVSGRPFYDAQGRFQGYRGVGRDVTEEVRNRETINRLIQALDHVEAVVALFDPDERLLFANTAYRRWLREPGMLDNKPTMPQIIDYMVEIGMLEDPETEASKRLEVFRNPDGPVELLRAGRWLLVRIEVLPDGGRILVASDITTQKNQELELIRAKEVAEHANASKSTFLANMSHELRTPLNAILGLSDMILTLGDRVEDRRKTEYIGDIRDAGTILLSHIEDILNFSRLDAGAVPNEPSAVDLRRAAARALRMVRPIARKRAVRIRAVVPRDLPLAFVDARALEQIIINLTTNAVAHSDMGQAILLTAVDGLVTGEGTYVAVEVRDQGCGMSAVELERVFEPFYQARAADLARDKETGTGTGLGLAIVKGLVDKSGGNIDMKSVQGEGTTVRILLPKAEQPPRESIHVASASSG
jgi:signal transduction histidine kinase